MEQEVRCPFCGQIFIVEEWNPDACSGCGEDYYWQEQLEYDDDGEIEDTWAMLWWNRWDTN